MKKSIKKLAIVSMIAMVVSSVIVNANESKSETKKHPREYLTLKIDSNAKTGGFFGGEIGIGINVGKQLDYYAVGYPNNTVIYSEVSNSPVLKINLIGGYQWYFYNHPNFSLGVRAKGYLGYGYCKDSAKDNNNNYYYTNSNSFNIGSELQVLWDFLNIDKHSLGIHFSPIGFDVSVGVNNKSYDTSNATQTTPNPGKETVVKTTPSYTISTGIHYYCDANHQLFLDYKYLANSYDSSYHYSINLKHLFTLGYSYKF